MRTGIEEPLATRVRQMRHDKCLSQEGLAELAGVSSKTVRRIESETTVAGSSRRAVAEALGIDLSTLGLADPTPPGGEAGARWAAVGDAGALFRQLAAAPSVDIDVDRDGWREARRSQPWYRQEIQFATKDPVTWLLEIVDRVAAPGEILPGARARQLDEFAAAIHGARALRWSLAYRLDPGGSLSLYIGSPAAAAERIGETPA